MTNAADPEGVRSRIPLYETMSRVPGGQMLFPLVLGSAIGTFAPGALGIGSFTTALFQDGALPLIGLLIFATGTQVTFRTGGPVIAHSLVILLCKSAIPATLIVLLGHFVGIQGILGVSILGLLATFDNSNGGLWLAFTGRYGDQRDRGAYLASAVNDGPFFSLLFLGASGLADIPGKILLAAVVPFLLGAIIGNIDGKWRDVLRPVPNIVIPFFAFALGTGIDLKAIATGGLRGIILGVAVVLITGAFVYLGYRFLLRRGHKSGLGIASATTAGNAIATPGIVAAADHRFDQYVGAATAQVAASVLVSAILAPIIASFVLKRAGGLTAEADEAETPEHPVDAQ